MAKIQIKLPDDPHRCQRRIQYGDTDSGGVVYYANYLRFFEQGRTELMRDTGCTYGDLEQQGLILPVVESYVRYQAPALYDDLITIHTALVEVQRLSCRFHYAITRQEGTRLLVKGFTMHAVVNRAGKLAKFPDPVLALLEKICCTELIA